jgi:farnesyl-diphosphate farnesyltransferase
MTSTNIRLMTAYRFNDAWSGSPEAYQDYILPFVSRTFALTIPQLPAGLRSVVANAYLLCRIADTIEDEPALGADDKRRFEEELAAVVAGRLDAGLLADAVVPRLSQQTLESERDLMRQLPLVIEVLRSFRPAQQSALLRCVTVMGRGMHRFQRSASLLGLADQREMDRYCYYVAGVVGEMLTELFCDFDPVMASRREPMMRLAVSFGQALQMTNILTDQWEDRARGACWLPRSVFEASGVNLDGLQAGQRSEGYARALTELIGVAHAHIRNGLDYTLMVPAQHSGIRRFCLWSLGLAILTLKNLHRHPEFAGATEIKVSRAAVARTITITNLAVRRDAVLRRLFEYAWRDLPLTDLGPDWSGVTRQGVRNTERIADMLAPGLWRNR